MIKKKKIQKNNIRLTRHEAIKTIAIAGAGLLVSVAYGTWYINSGMSARHSPESLSDLFVSYVTGAVPVLVFSGVFVFGISRLLRGRLNPALYRSILVTVTILGAILGTFLFIYLDMSAYFSPDSGRTIFSF